MRRIPFATFYMDSKPLEIMLTTMDKEMSEIINIVKTNKQNILKIAKENIVYA